MYEATLTTATAGYEKKYIGLCETTFKKRFFNHKQSFSTEKYKNSTALSLELENERTKSTTQCKVEDYEESKSIHSGI